MSLYSKDYLKEGGGGGGNDDQNSFLPNQYFYNIDASGAGPDPNHQSVSNGFNFGSGGGAIGGYGGVGGSSNKEPAFMFPGSQPGPRTSMPPNLPLPPQQNQNLFRPPQGLHLGGENVHYVNSAPTPSRPSPPGNFSAQAAGGIMGGLSFPSNVASSAAPGPGAVGAGPASMGARSLLGGPEPSGPGYSLPNRFAAPGNNSFLPTIGSSMGALNSAVGPVGVGAVGAVGGSALLREDDVSEDFPALPSAKHDVGMIGNPTVASSNSIFGNLEKFSDGALTPASSNLSAAGLNSSLYSPPISALVGARTASSDGLVGAAGLTSTATPAAAGSVGRDGRYGLAGFVEVHRAAEKDSHALALGMDMTTFGLNLNSVDPLYLSFTSPFGEVSPIESPPAFSLPACYSMHHPPALKTDHLSKFHVETLFYMFYQLPRDILQACAAQELYRREWRYHAELRLWLQPRSASDLAQSHPGIQFIYFDAKAWEVRLFNTATFRGNLKAGLVPEEDIRVKPPLPGLAPIGEPS